MTELEIEGPEGNTQPLIDHRTWKKRGIVTLWSLQIPVLALDIVILSILTGVQTNGAETPDGTTDSSAPAWTIVNVVLSFIAFLVDCVEFSMYVHNDLSPKIYFWLNVSNLIMFTVPFFYNISVNWTAWATRGLNYLYIYVGIGFSSFIYVTFIASFIYAFAVQRIHRQRSRSRFEKAATESRPAQADDRCYN
ncbi:hypothetical protein QTJ16_002885 [Diplocarpon rosae]|uniref:Uncharacterized protein n=1 Tax=Diplocarpon rosae TaxID=946125 RepID=A0AAD9T451_9HELO|nr:hypothetical protein QTJ16_002885 [Diplocarpon rosae]